MKQTSRFTVVGMLWLLMATATPAALVVQVSPPKTTGNKAIVKLELKNTFTEKIPSARAVCFLLDDQGQMVGQSTKWVIGQNKIGLDAGATNEFNFVITSPQPFTTTNLTAKISFSRVVLEDGKLADPKTAVQIQTSK
jgi:hypothetical protein